jgi:hypothetical protein
MAVTISLYNHTRARFLSGANAVGDTYKVKLFTAATFNASDTTEAEAGGTEHDNINGYITGGATLANVDVTIANVADAKFDADDVSWAATGGEIEASYARIYNDTDTDKPPVAFIDFGGTETADAGTDFKLIWNAAGIITAVEPA